MKEQQILIEYNKLVDWINYRVKNPSYIPLQSHYQDWMPEQMETFKKLYVNNPYNENSSFKTFQEYDEMNYYTFGINNIEEALIYSYYEAPEFEVYEEKLPEIKEAASKIEWMRLNIEKTSNGRYWVSVWNINDNEE